MNSSASSLFSEHSSDSSTELAEVSQMSAGLENWSAAELCEHCQLLDLDASFESASKFYEGVREGSVSRPEDLERAPNGTYFYKDAFLVHNFEKRLSQPSKCPLCKFFRALRVQRNSHERYKLLAFCSSDSWMFRRDLLWQSTAWTEIKDTVFMAVLPDIESIPPCGHEENWLERDVPARGAIYRLQAKGLGVVDDGNLLLGAREMDDKVNIQIVDEWFSVCRKYHGNACERRSSHEPISRSFRLINCTVDPPRVEARPWGTEYAALSYVWGTMSEDRVEWPSTVLDAVAVTRDLGLQYLWVDRCCINQTDEEEKAYLVSRMMTIYENACFTIVAAAGSGASCGLPGVRSTPRKPQPKYTLDGGGMLLSTLRDPRRDILESEYWTRGWTYQEGVLSNRRIVFTHDQVYWECRCMAIHESIVMPLFHILSSNSEDSVSRMNDFVLTGIFKGDAYSGGSLGDDDDLVIARDDAYRLDYGFPMYQEATIRAQIRGLNEHIRAFSRRNLTYDADSLPAFLGITSMYKQNKLLYLLQGIPVWIGRLADGVSGVQVTFALSVCSWYHRSSPDFQMFVSEPCRRKYHLPSWTWAGWDGTVTWRAPPENEHSALMSDLIAARTPSFIWAADIYLSSPNQSEGIRLYDTMSLDCLERETPSLIEVKDPFILKYFRRKETEKKWKWVRIAGRAGRKQHQVDSYDWDSKWYRIAGRLCCIGVSVSMAEEEWSQDHFSGELISVLLFAGKYPSSVHGCARFVTLRRAKLTGEQWERIGALYLIIPDDTLRRCATNAELLKKLPVIHKPEMKIVIQ